MKKLIIITGILTLLAVIVSMSGCASGSPGTPTTPTQPMTTAPSPVGITFGSAAQLGKTVYTNACSICHGINGEGKTAPAVIGASASLSKYGTAKGLLDFVSTTMPAKAPGSLSHPDYLNILSYLLVQNNAADPAAAFNESGLASVQLK
jgi:polar amino acid transport system substrate-binding protein